MTLFTRYRIRLVTTFSSLSLRSYLLLTLLWLVVIKFCKTDDADPVPCKRGLNFLPSFLFSFMNNLGGNWESLVVNSLFAYMAGQRDLSWTIDGYKCSLERKTINIQSICSSQPSLIFHTIHEMPICYIHKLISIMNNRYARLDYAVTGTTLPWHMTVKQTHWCTSLVSWMRFSNTFKCKFI